MERKCDQMHDCGQVLVLKSSGSQLAEGLGPHSSPCGRIQATGLAQASALHLPQRRKLLQYC